MYSSQITLEYGWLTVKHHMVHVEGMASKTYLIHMAYWMDMSIYMYSIKDDVHDVTHL